MYKARVFTADGEQGAERELPESIFDGVVHQAAMWQTVKAYLANQRHGTASTKNRSAVRGGSRKPWRQKGTGRARQGTIRAPQWRGGGVVFGPTAERNFRETVPRKLKRLARRSAFNARAEDQSVVLIEGFDFETPKTRRLVELLESVGAEGNVLVLTEGTRPEIYLSARNLESVRVSPFGEESVYDVLWSDVVVIESTVLDGAEEDSDE